MNLNWKDIELAIKDEEKWLRNSILPFHKNSNPLNKSDDIFFREIAILILSRKVVVREYIFDFNDFINKLSSNKTIDKMHGSNWHDSSIKKISRYLKDKGFEVYDDQPGLTYGFSDLFINIPNNPIFIEIDTISIFKLWINLKSMTNSRIMNIRTDKIIEFQIYG